MAREPSPDLAAELRSVVRGAVRFDRATRAVYSTDASSYRAVPVGVVEPLDGDDVAAVLEVCRYHRVPVLPRGAGTSLAGQGCNTAVVLDFRRHMDRIIDVDPERRLARVQPGVVLDDLRRAAGPHGLTFGPDPATHAQCTLGGMIGNNSCGPHSLTSGRTSDNVHELAVLLADGTRLVAGALEPAELERRMVADDRPAQLLRRLVEIRDRWGQEIRDRYPQIPRRVSGYNLDDLLPERGFHLARALTGSEGTCVVLLEATVRLVVQPPARVLLIVGFDDVVAAAESVTPLLDEKPSGLEGLDHRCIRDPATGSASTAARRELPEGDAWIFVELAGESEAEVADRGRRLQSKLAASSRVRGIRLAVEPSEQGRLWAIRESGLAAASRTTDGRPTWPGWEDSAVAPDRFASYLREFRSLLDRHHLDAAFYGHFGDGCLHSRIDFDLATRDGIAAYRVFLEAAADLVVAHGGSLSGEHGDGRARAHLLERMLGSELVQAQRAFKKAFDPDGLLNPGRVVDPDPVDEDLRAAVLAPRPAPPTTLAFPGDGHDLKGLALRCVGVGRCTRTDASDMCPSFRATREELHSTRGRARILAELLTGELLPEGLQAPELLEALELCLSCKACLSDCPAGVDMASLKAELLHHYWRGRLRPRQALVVGLAHRWIPIAARMPRLANAFACNPGLAPLTAALTGLRRDRPLPMLAAEPFRRTERRWRPSGNTGREIVLWPDTFNDHYTPSVLAAAWRVLDRVGYVVHLPRQRVCCGRPLFDQGMLDEARRQLRQACRILAPHLRAGRPVVGLEPGCLSVFRDELPRLLPDDPMARELSRRAVSLAELLQEDGVDLDSAGGEVLYQGHCHARALGWDDAAPALLGRLGYDVRRPGAGCCGGAGGFSWGERTAEVADRCGELGPAPAIRDLGDGAELVADGFSCREQAQHLTGRRPLHLAQLLDGQGSAARDVPDEAARPWSNRQLLAAGGLAAGALLFWSLLPRRR